MLKIMNDEKDESANAKADDLYKYDFSEKGGNVLYVSLFFQLTKFKKNYFCGQNKFFGRKFETLLDLTFSRNKLTFG